jgi:hypothetical protein
VKVDINKLANENFPDSDEPLFELLCAVGQAYRDSLPTDKVGLAGSANETVVLGLRDHLEEA